MLKIPPKVEFHDSMKASYNYDRGFVENDKYWERARQNYEDYFLTASESSGDYRIPRIIHQIWLGGELPQKYKKWTESWKTHHPDWEYHLWTDDKLEGIEMQCEKVFRETRNYGPKSDILRYELLNQFGGLYIDTDFECFRPFDYLHQKVDFYAGIEFGKELNTTTSIIASAPGHPIIKDLLDSMDRPVISDNSEEIHEVTGPWAFSRTYRAHIFDAGYRNMLMPTGYFFPFPNNKLHIQNEKKILAFRREESMAMHYWEVSWLNRRNFLRRTISRCLRYIPADFKLKIKKALGRPV